MYRIKIENELKYLSVRAKVLGKRVIEHWWNKVKESIKDNKYSAAIISLFILNMTVTTVLAGNEIASEIYENFVFVKLREFYTYLDAYPSLKKGIGIFVFQYMIISLILSFYILINERKKQRDTTLSMGENGFISTLDLPSMLMLKEIYHDFDEHKNVQDRKVFTYEEMLKKDLANLMQMQVEKIHVIHAWVRGSKLVVVNPKDGNYHLEPLVTELFSSTIVSMSETFKYIEDSQISSFIDTDDGRYKECIISQNAGKFKMVTIVLLREINSQKNGYKKQELETLLSNHTSIARQEQLFPKYKKSINPNK
ncbi:TPA: hypothetical protein QCV53_002402 [Bacillus cereus]|nr:hypothetical protein [Bacillus cereus]